LPTDGKGLYTKVAANVNCTDASLSYVNKEKTFGELRVYFTGWDVNKNSIIYTDNLWLRGLRDKLMKIGFTAAAAKDVDYSESGMQGDDYVSLDVGVYFLKEWFSINRKS
jgi:hypothetical protein